MHNICVAYLNQKPNILRNKYSFAGVDNESN